MLTQIDWETGDTELLRLMKTRGKGEGVFSTTDIKRGEVVLKGEILKKSTHNTSHTSQIGENEFVYHAGLNSKFNHSCSPNCGIKLNSTGAHDFVAMRDIGAGEELTYDYAMRNYIIEYFPGTCSCGSKDCRITISGWKDLPKSIKQRYKGFVAPYLYELDKKNR